MTLRRWLQRTAMGVAALAGSAAALEGPPAGEGGVADAFYHWAVKSKTAAPGDPDDFQANIDVTDTPFVRDTMLLYSCQCGNFPFNGPQEALPAVNPTWMDDHLAQIAKHLDMFVPDPDFSGLIVIDYEEWDLLWDRTDEEFRKAWIAYAGPLGEAKLRSGYEAASRAFYEATIKRVKELRPAARVGFFAYPVKFYLAATETSRGVIGYGDGQYVASDRNDTLGWLWAIQDFLAPNVYCRFETVEDPDPALTQNTPAKDKEYLRSNTAEALRLANGKPVYVVVWYEYQRKGDHRLAEMFLNDLNMEHQLWAPFDAGVTGVILWGRVETQKRATELDEYFHGTIVPLLDPGGELCPSDLDGNGTLDLFDFLAFTNLFNDQDPEADWDGSGSLDLFDFTRFLNDFNAGC